MKKMFAVAAAFVALTAGQVFAGSVTFTRADKWVNGSTADAVYDSDSEANSAGNLWKYEVAPGPTNPDNELNGTSPWYKQPSTTVLTYVPASLRWEGTHGGYPRVAFDRMIGRTAAAAFGYQPRVVFTIPADGTVTLAGKFLVSRNDLNDATIEWVIGKRVGTTYTDLAKGSVAVTAQTATEIDLAAHASALTDIAVAAGDEIFWSYRQTTAGPAAAQDQMTDNQLTITLNSATSGIDDWSER